MNTRQLVEAKAKSSQEQALDAFWRRRPRYATLARRPPSAPTTSREPRGDLLCHVSSLSHYVSLLRQITDMAFNEAKHTHRPPRLPQSPRHKRGRGSGS